MCPSHNDPVNAYQGPAGCHSTWFLLSLKNVLMTMTKVLFHKSMFSFLLCGH